jgi:class 3 adenylate cyclase/predicted ATPase
MECPKCRAENLADSSFCSECGAKIEVSCPACGAGNLPGAKFCRKCGERQGAFERPSATRVSLEPRSYTPKHLAEKILTSRSALEGERKQVTVLFADVKGSMDLAEQVDPEAWHKIMDRFFAILSEGVHRFEGTINQYTGDGIMALFGAPVAHEDHARRACYAALALQEDLRRYANALRLEKGLSFSVRMGLNSGEVVVGKIGDDLRMDYTAQGHTVGLAARMEQLAESGKAYLSEHTAALVDGFVTLQDLGRLALKGVKEPIRVYELQGIGKLRTKLDVSRARGFSRFVGRADEMASLEAALGRAIQCNGQVVGVVAHPGLGKSRLCFEFAERCRARGITVYEAHGVSHGKLIPFLPILELFRAFFRITDQDGSEAAREKIAGRMLLLDEGLKDALPLMFDFLEVPDLERPVPQMDPQARLRQLFGVVKRIAQARSKREPAVVLLEDLHWFDGGSEAVLEVLVDTAESNRTLIVVNFRPEYHAGWMQRSYYQQLPLLPLGNEAIAELLRDLLGPDSSVASLGSRIRERTGGVPFFIEEIVQSLAEAGSLEGKRGAYRLVQPVAELALPGTVQAVLAARVDRLEEREKKVLQTAAVIGRQFTEPILRRVVELPEADLARALDKLAAAEFIFERALYPQAEYIFKHALTQEVAYNSLLTDRRQTLHERTAEAIREQFGDRLEESWSELAHHYSHSRSTEKAIEYSKLAGERAVKGSANTEAISHLTTALELLESLPDSLERSRRELKLQIAVGVPLMATKGFGASEVGASYSRALELCRTVGETAEVFPVLFGLSVFYLIRAELRKGRELAAQLLDLAERVGDPACLLPAHLRLSTASFYLGEPTVSRAHSEQGIALYDPERHGSLAFVYNQDLGVNCLGWAAITLWFLGYPGLALTRKDEALLLAGRIAHRFSQVFPLYFASWLHALRREWPMATEHAEETVALSAEQGFADWQFLGTFVRGQALAEQGRTDEGVGEMLEAMAALPSIGFEIIRPYNLAVLAAAYGKAGRTDDALALVAEALALVERREERWWEADICRVRGELLASRRSSDAETSFRHAIDVARRQSAKSLELRAVTSLSRLLRKQGKRDEARQMLAEIYGWFTEGFGTADLQDAKALLEELS